MVSLSNHERNWLINFVPFKLIVELQGFWKLPMQGYVIRNQFLDPFGIEKDSPSANPLNGSPLNGEP